jgi:hypothetical protein
MKCAGQPAAICFGALLLLIISPSLARGADDENDEYQLNLNPHHAVTDHLDMFGNFGYFDSPSDYSKYRFGWPGLIYGPIHWLQLWDGLDARYTDNYDSADTLELRPFAGVKLFAPNDAKILLYNFTRYEYRAFQNQETHDWDEYSRIRSRFGVEVPLTTRAKAWEPKTFYALAGFEPFYRFDEDEWDPVHVRGGIGYVVNHQVRAEIIYTAQFTRESHDDPLEFTDNILELNIKIAFRGGVLGRFFNPGD